MNRINTPRVVLGGLVAGFVMAAAEVVHIIYVGGFHRALIDLGATEVGPFQMAVTLLAIAVAATIMMWTYAVMRDRYGAGPATAIRVGLPFALLTHMLPAVALWGLGLLPAGVAVVHAVWGLIAVPLGLVAGAALYREEPAHATEPAVTSTEPEHAPSP